MKKKHDYPMPVGKFKPEEMKFSPNLIDEDDLKPAVLTAESLLEGYRYWMAVHEREWKKMLARAGGDDESTD